MFSTTNAAHTGKDLPASRAPRALFGAGLAQTADGGLAYDFERIVR